MKKIATLTMFALSIPAISGAVEFRTPGVSLGIGGAGVARDNGALSSYWNPAGGAFNKSSFDLNVGVGAGARGSDGLAENVDRFSNISLTNLTQFNTATATTTEVGDFVKTVSIFGDIDARKGNMAIAAEAPIGFTMKNFSFGLFFNLTGDIQPKADIVNILPNTSAVTGGRTLSTNDLYTAAVTNSSATSYSSPSGYFSATQLTQLQTELNKSLNNVAKSTQLANAIDNQLQNSGITPDQAISSLVGTTTSPSSGALATLNSGGTTTFNKNTTSVLTRAIQYIEIPVSYGRPFDFGTSGQLGIGATAKLISGTVYQNQVLLANRPSNQNLKASDLINEITKNNKSSANIGIDLGALYKYDKWLNVGLVAKNINSPTFSAPQYFQPVYNPVTGKVESTSAVAGDDIQLKTQVRSGIAVEPYGWLTIAADLDLTENDTLAPGTVVGSSAKSRNFGGGVELRPMSWLKVRGGTYKNLALTNAGSVLTAGFTLFLLEVDGAFATNSFKIGNTTLPQEVEVHASINLAF